MSRASPAMTWITLLAALAVGASTNGVAATATDETLEPEQAFPVTARLAAKPGKPGIELVFRIADSYYLYANRFKVEAEPGPLELGTLQVPRGIAKDDPFIGRTEIFRKSVRLRLPFAQAPRAGTYVLKVTAQGCAENRLCYAPFTQPVTVRIPPS
jgi:thiol:disulfide interchange protein DsbD